MGELALIDPRPSAFGVLSRGHGFKVGRVQAGRVNADVIDVVAIWNRPDVHGVAQAMGHPSVTCPAYEDAVVVSIAGTDPFPAIPVRAKPGRSIHLRPESFLPPLSGQFHGPGPAKAGVMGAAHAVRVDIARATLNRTRVHPGSVAKPPCVAGAAHLSDDGRGIWMRRALGQGFFKAVPNMDHIRGAMFVLSLVVLLTQAVAMASSCASINRAVGDWFNHGPKVQLMKGHIKWL